ncbi:isocitrate lyase/PEP mutase family protein [Aspergillus brunneoviolaceus CBS 621.78]|uniref:Phosphoenolpyruvate/pyruvate domain-containing protein n=1 Tax=Aspergillus brunneoviolaceus CBS 621.78 TaxID=1450534 RepID=A0ACD1GDD6_9EURO|nr:Phosphoenolpyruvate/pyruvate domain-containing protein [Aspergillus brunneoviolaceus CBS 621.78]RAH47134.1 Phosphoenolpyruvate/pyruvate domain-containing protein [Aspergillus brunneoviolaceus CBS 621.78]
MTTPQNTLAQHFKSLHRPRHPLILANVYDAATAQTVASLPSARAIATASYAVAAAAGTSDEELPCDELLGSATAIASAVRPTGKPLSIDIRDGYNTRLPMIVQELLDAGVVGVNLEDFDNAAKTMYSRAEAVQRIRTVLGRARAAGVPDFVVNARCDALLHGGTLEEVIARGREYLAAGAATVFVWGGATRGGTTREEVGRLVEAFEGRLNVKAVPGGLTTKELAAMGVARVSVGPALLVAALERVREVAEGLLTE